MPQLTHTSSLAHLPLSRLGDRIRPATAAWELTTDETCRLVTAMIERSDAAAARLAETTRRAAASGGGRPDPAAALHHLLTRNRFLKGSRSLFPRRDALALIRRFTDSGAPVRLLVRGFPFKQRDNRLKAAGPQPDLAELGALVRLRELRQAFRDLYPPGLRVTVLSDGGYYRSRPSEDLSTYRQGLARLAALAGVDGYLTVRAQAEVLAAAVGPDQWRYRTTLVEGLVGEFTATTETARRRYAADLATGQLARLGPSPPGVPPFRAIFDSILYCVPVPGGDSLELSAAVLGAVSDLRVPPPLRDARRAVLDRAWRDALRYVATATVDARLQLFDRLPPHVRLSTGVPRAGTFGFTYLGGSTLLPWHGTGCIDRGGAVGVDFLVASLARGLTPVYSPLAGTGQPWCLVAPVDAERAETLTQLLATIRLKPR